LDPFGEHSDERLWRALCATELGADIYRFILPGSPRDCPDIAEDTVIEKGSIKYHCLNWPVKPDGENLSVGQRQLICIARMILRQPSILLLDECTSAIDPRTQEVVQNSIRTNFPKSTMVSIAHRLETIMDFDTVHVMKSGLCIKSGCPRDFGSVVEMVTWAKKEDKETGKLEEEAAKDPIVTSARQSKDGQGKETDDAQPEGQPGKEKDAKGKDNQPGKEKDGKGKDGEPKP
jgi:ABC-type multidrug transport system ATPase subunit